MRTNNSGFVKIHRSILDWEWYKNPNTKIVFLHLILNANFEASKFEGITIPRGTCICSVKSIAETNGLTEKQVRVALEHLKKTNEVAIRTTNKFSIITVLNYDLYQTNGKQDGEQWANGGQTNGNPTATLKEIKNLKKEKNVKNNIYSNDGASYNIQKAIELSNSTVPKVIKREKR